MPPSLFQVHRTSLFAALLLCGILPSALADPPTSIPAFAHLGGIRVGLDTVQRLEKRWGQGKPMLGGHPRGGRIWRTSSPAKSIYVDGFDSFDRRGVPYSGGRQIDTFSAELLATSDDVSDLPLARLDQRQLRFMDRVNLGDSRRSVLAALSAILPPPEQTDHELIWHATGFVRVKSGVDGTTTTWKATLIFAKDRLVEIRVGCNE